LRRPVAAPLAGAALLPGRCRRNPQAGAGTLTGADGVGVTRLLAPVQAQCATLIAPYGLWANECLLLP